MIAKATIIQGMYLDSVKLMLISKELRACKGVQDAVAILATKENREILAATDMLIDAIKDAKETEIVVVVKANSMAEADAALASADTLLHAKVGKRAGKSKTLNSIKSASASMEKADLCLISVAGKYAAAEAEKALDMGMHVMLFSDNVSVSDELKLKQKAISQGLLMMGPDCGTAIINGVPLAFSNAVPKGRIGIVSASGTGLQEVSCGIANRSRGISQAFGTGGRDGKAEIGGIMLCACLEYLMEDNKTDVIVLIGKTPVDAVQHKLWKLIGSSTKPVIVNFLKDMQVPEIKNLSYAASLEDTADLACKALNDSLPVEVKCFKFDFAKPNIAKDRKFIRGLYSGGTLCYEALQLYKREFGAYPKSNIAAESKDMLSNVWHSEGDCFIDMGADDFTVGRPHPMIDYSLRLKKIAEEAADGTVAVILLDVVLGFGANADPASELAPVLCALPTNVAVVCHVLGTAGDPQHIEEQLSKLAACGARVFTSHLKAVNDAFTLLKAHRRENG
ncbi:MAG: FdrA [Candidatus Cloacimonetes bacterium HGW-Cloacimonetes-3]|nr:MAG: FdrA [Candidatus Cloacimonetes bacterium HGW-Cloacimonetes-3]